MVMVSTAITFELHNNKPTATVQGQHVEPVCRSRAAGSDLPVELERNDLQIGPEDLRMVNDPLLQMLTFLQALGRQRHRRGRVGVRAIDCQDHIAHRGRTLSRRTRPTSARRGRAETSAQYAVPALMVEGRRLVCHLNHRGPG
jgi:hypothetical protein